MRVRQFIYNSETATETAQDVRERLRNSDLDAEVLDLGIAEDYADARREAMLAVGEATRIGPKPDALFDDDGTPDFSAGALILDRETGRRELHVGEDALAALGDATGYRNG